MTESPKTRVPTYSAGIIYKLCCKDPTITDCYIGSTTNFIKRKSQHKASCNVENSKGYNYYVYRFIREHDGFDNWDMIQIEKYEAKDKKDLETRERYWIETLKSSLNKVIPTRTQKEWYDVNKEDVASKHKNYYEDNKECLALKRKEYLEVNKEKTASKTKEYYENNKEELSLKYKEYYKKNKEKIISSVKEYSEKNKEKISLRNKKYYEVNKEKIASKCVESVVCDICSGNYLKPAKLRHERTKKHQKALTALTTS